MTAVGAREFAEGVTFREFRAMATERGWTVERLLERLPKGFGGPSDSRYYESPRAYLERVLRAGHAVDNDHVIPFRSLVQIYVEETQLERAIPSPARRCACGCGSVVYGRQRCAGAACRQRVRRTRRERSF